MFLFIWFPWTVDQLACGKPNPDKSTLNWNTVLFIEKIQSILGHLFHVFDPVTKPYYCVKINSSEHINENDVNQVRFSI